MSVWGSALQGRADGWERRSPTAQRRREGELRGAGSPPFPRVATDDHRDARPQPDGEVSISPRAVEPRGIIEIELRPNPDGERRQADARKPPRSHFRPHTEADKRARRLSGIGLATLAVGVRSQLNLDDAT